MVTLLWHQLQLDEFWLAALPPSREGTSWLNILKTLVGYQLISPGSEWRLHRHWFEHSAMGDLLSEDAALVSRTICIAVWKSAQANDVHLPWHALEGSVSGRFRGAAV
jgi:hypothetical protein